MRLGKVWNGEEIAKAVNGTPLFEAEKVKISHISWDTRQLDRGNVLFIALRAQRDGHTYVEEAFSRGAKMALVERAPLSPLPCIVVSDTWKALHQWASKWRACLSYPILALTGSVGKTWIKEWLAYLLEGKKQVHRSPGSFNSRLGIPVSLLSFPAEGDLALIEVGISAPGEMEPLARLIRPTYGMLTPMGKAHDEAFPNFDTKLREKLLLFEEVKWLLALFQPETVDVLRKVKVPLYLIGENESFYWCRQAPKRGEWYIADKGGIPIALPEDSLVAWQNAILAASAAYLLGVSAEHLQEKLVSLPVLAHRLQWIQDENGRLWLNDTYHADASSVSVAIEELRQTPLEPKVAILTDFSPYTKESHEAAIGMLREFLPPSQIHLIGSVFSEVEGEEWRYASVESFLREAVLPPKGVILLKGSRRFRLEEAFSRLTGYGPGPRLQIDWEKVYRNLAALRRHLPPHTRLMGVLKAEAYGGGDLLMASFLQRQGIDSIGVAYTQEALRLREAGIRLPILVFYPGEAPHRLYKDYSLEAAVGTWQAMDYWAGAVPLHIEFDTGMGRMGLPAQDLEKILSFLQERKAEVRGVFSHLASAETPTHPFTIKQLERFDKIYNTFRQAFPGVIGHILNTAGILCIGERAAYDMVRVGIGLYGIGPGLEEVTRLTAPILRVEAYPTDIPFNYGFRSTLPSDREIVTVGIGYGDGLPRIWAENGAYVYLHGVPCAVLPPLNMDLMLIAAPKGLAHVGEQVEIWGSHRSLSTLAKEAKTIPYELLVRLSKRVRRVYSWGNVG
ncbi:MAG: alanine racemase [Bacteroidia bacterium]|nr:alanine racemase [Bacteroidia bacterium]MDW8015655.1 alanine racemase [Bacteroidia bacterium]